MKMAIIIPGFVPVPDVVGGAVERLITYLIQQNENNKYFDIDLYTIDHKKIGNLKYDNTKLYKIKLSKAGIVYDKILNYIFRRFKIEKSVNQYSRKSLRYLKKIEYDYILIENNMYIYKDVYSKISKIFPDTKFIFHLHNDIGKIDKPISLSNYILSTATTVLTCSKYLKDRLESIAISDTSNKIKVLYNVIDFNKLVYKESARNKLRSNYNISNNFVFGYVGRISKEKGILELVKAFKKLYFQNNNLRLMIIGDTLFKNIRNKYFEKFKAEVDEIKDAIIYTGSIDNSIISDYMSAMDAIVIPTICEEAFGIVAAEAIACCRPTVATKSGGMVEILNEDISLLIDKNNIVEQLELSLKKIVNEYDNYIKKAEFGRTILEGKKEFYIDNYLKNFYLKIVNENFMKDM